MLRCCRSPEGVGFQKYPESISRSWLYLSCVGLIAKLSNCCQKEGDAADGGQGVLAKACPVLWKHSSPR